MKDGSRLLSILLKVSEKAANIARTCRQNDALFKLLVQEKSEEEKNPRFCQDFKTLADVLIQETIRHDIEVEVSHSNLVLNSLYLYFLFCFNQIIKVCYIKYVIINGMLMERYT